jgi:uncharacterized protein YbcI
MSSTEADQPTSGNRSNTAAISNMVVRVISEHTGRGPTKARTHLSQDLITVVLHDTLTKGERSLARADKGAIVLTMRFAFRETMRDELVRGVEEITGREVAAFMGASHIDPDMAIESFVLVPRTPAAVPSFSGSR